MLKSLFGLIKSNKGQFKSEKQAQYLLSNMNDGLYVSRQTLSFGEHDGRTSRNTASVEWEFYCTGDGIQSVHKITSKGRVEHWANTEAHHAKADAKQALHIAECLVNIAGAKQFSQERIDQLFKEYAITESNELMQKHGISAELQAQLKESAKARLNQELSQYQQWAIDSKVAYYESLPQAKGAKT